MLRHPALPRPVHRIAGSEVQGIPTGGRDNGAPGKRPYHLGHYAAFVLDPDGYKIEAVYQGEAKRSAPAVEIRFQHGRRSSPVQKTLQPRVRRSGTARVRKEHRGKSFSLRLAGEGGA